MSDLLFYCGFNNTQGTDCDHIFKYTMAGLVMLPLVLQNLVLDKNLKKKKKLIGGWEMG